VNSETHTPCNKLQKSVPEQTSHSVISYFWRACRCTNWSSCWIRWAKWKHFSMSRISKARLS